MATELRGFPAAWVTSAAENRKVEITGFVASSWRWGLGLVLGSERGLTHQPRWRLRHTENIAFMRSKCVRQMWRLVANYKCTDVSEKPPVFIAIYPDYGDSKFPWKVGTLLPDHVTSYRRWLYLLLTPLGEPHMWLLEQSNSGIRVLPLNVHIL